MVRLRENQSRPRERAFILGNMFRLADILAPADAGVLSAALACATPALACATPGGKRG